MDPDNTTHQHPIVVGGSGLSPLYRTASASYLGIFFRVAGPLIYHLAHMGGTTTSNAVALLADPLAAKRDHGWATNVYSAHHEALEL